MTTDLETASRIAGKVTKTMKEWDVPIEVNHQFVLMVYQVIKETRKELRNSREKSDG